MLRNLLRVLVAAVTLRQQAVNLIAMLKRQGDCLLISAGDARMTGIICINKGKDITSFGVVSKVRGITREKKAGHTGTLDPMATGVLPIMLGGATRFLNYLPDSDKGYRARFLLGKTTDTLDITGEVTGEYDVAVSIDDVESALVEFRERLSKFRLCIPLSALTVKGFMIWHARE